MKKLITIMASMATCLLFGDFASSGTSFEGYAGDTLDPSKDDQGADLGYRYWSSATSDNAIYVLTNYVDEVGSDATKTPTNVVSRPDMFASDSNTKYLAIDTDTRLYRSAESIQSADFTPVTIPNNGIYLDTLVKFTPAEDETGLVLEGTDKIAIAYVENPETFKTNFVVRAGYLSSTIVQTNYVVAVPSGFKSADWHRLTVRSFASIDAAGDVGFVVYLDEVPLEYDTAVDAGPSFTPSGAAAAFYTSEVHALFPSAVPFDQIGGQTIAAVAFTGNGAVDDVTFTTEKPNFIKAGEAVRAEITLGTGVTDVTVTVAGTPYEAVETNGTTFVFNFLAGTTSFVLGVTADSANGYTFDETTGITPTDVTYDAATDTVTITGASPALTVKGTRNNFSLFDENGDTISGTFETLGAALAAQGVAKIQLAYDYTVADADIETYGFIRISQSITLDLNGKELDGGESVSNPLFLVSDGNFVIIDSVGGGKVVYHGPGIVFGATAYIGAVNDDLGPTFDGPLFLEGGEGNVIRGKFDETSNTAAGDEPAFLWEAYLGDGDSVESECTGPVAGYWVVAPKGGSEPTTYAISWTLTGGTTEATAGDFEENATIVFTAESGKTLSYVEIDGVEDTSAYGASSYTYTVGTADAELVVTFTEPAPTTYEVTWTLTGGTTTETSGADFEESDTIVFTAESGKTLSYVSIDGTEISDTSVYGASSYTYTVGTADAVLEVTFTAGSSGWEPDPSKIDPAATAADTYSELAGTALATANAKKLTEWATAQSIDFADVTSSADDYVDAYLLNCALAEADTEKAAFKCTEISYDAKTGKWDVETTTQTTKGAAYNGTVTVKQYSDVGCKTESVTGTFFRAVLDL